MVDCWNCCWCRPTGEAAATRGGELRAATVGGKEVVVVVEDVVV